MEIRTYIMGLVEGWKSALEGLDNQVRDDLGTDIRIHSVRDTLYKRKDRFYSESNNKDDDCLARVVVYERRE